MIDGRIFLLMDQYGNCYKGSSSLIEILSKKEQLEERPLFYKMNFHIYKVLTKHRMTMEEIKNAYDL